MAQPGYVIDEESDAAGVSELQPDERVWNPTESEEIVAEIGEVGSDAVRDYLLTIGQRRLLTHEEEIRLGIAVSTWMLLKETRKKLQTEYGRPASPSELVAAIHIDLNGLREVLKAVLASLDEDGQAPSTFEALSLPPVRAALDSPPSPELKEAIAEATGTSPDEAGVTSRQVV